MKKNGFISVAIIYSFFLIFLSFMTFLLNSYRQNSDLIASYQKRIKENFLNINLNEVKNENIE